MAEAIVRIDERGFESLYEPRGDVYEYTKDLAQRIAMLARRYVGKNTHRLEHSIGFRLLRTPTGVTAEVGSGNKIALLHHNGTRPHIITPNHQRVMRFKQGGRVVYATVVFHPGTKPNPYLLRALREVVH